MVLDEYGTVLLEYGANFIYVEFLVIPSNFVSTQFPEFRTGITYNSKRLTYNHITA